MRVKNNLDIHEYIILNAHNLSKNYYPPVIAAAFGIPFATHYTARTIARHAPKYVSRHGYMEKFFNRINTLGNISTGFAKLITNISLYVGFQNYQCNKVVKNLPKNVARSGVRYYKKLKQSNNDPTLNLVYNGQIAILEKQIREKSETK